MMKSTRRIVIVIGAALFGATIVGCASHPTDHIVFVGSMQPANAAIASLGAGDSIGLAINANDIVLARAVEENARGNALADVPDDDID